MGLRQRPRYVCLLLTLRLMAKVVNFCTRFLTWFQASFAQKELKGQNGMISGGA